MSESIDAAEQAQKDFPGPTDFAHLHVHSIFSTLDGVASPDELCQQASAFGHPGFALTDHGSMAGLANAFWAAQKHGLRFIAGNEVYYNDYHKFMSRPLDEKGKPGPWLVEHKGEQYKLAEMKESSPEFYYRCRRNRHLTVLAKNEIGYKNLAQINSRAWDEGFFFKYPRTCFEMLAEHHEGLIILSGCLNGPVCHELRMSFSEDGEEDHDSYFQRAMEYVKKFHDVWGDDYYLELQMPGKEIPGGFEAFVATAAISKDLGIPGVITNDVHYINRGDFRVQKAMMAIKQGLTIDDPNLFHVNSDEQFFKCRAQLRQTFYELGFHEYVKIKQFEEFCDNTVAVVEKCAGFQPDISPKLPEMKDAEHELMKATIRGLRKKGLWNCEKKYEVDGKMVTYREQVKIELDRFITKGFASYFLITQDLVNYSADQLGMPVGPARGSAGGSLVCYALGIHELDPLKWGLSFNRFLSQSRGGWMLKVTMD